MSRSTEDLTPIWEFFAERDVFTLATAIDGQPYCTPCFYAFDKEHRQLIFKSSRDTRHVTELLKNKLVAGSILPDKLAIGQVKGIQFTGEAMLVTGSSNKDTLTERYNLRFPMARAVPGELWVLRLTTAKLTDSKLGFGKKLNWARVRTETPGPYR